MVVSMLTPQLIAIEAVGVLAGAVAIAELSKWRPRGSMGKPRAAVAVAPVAEFRRPVEFGPLRLPWDEMERLRVEVLIDQLAAIKDDTADMAYVDLAGGERVGHRPAVDREEARENTLFWLSHWDDAVLAMTGRTLR